MMSHTRTNKILITSEEYAESRERHSNAQSKRMTGKNHPMYGKHLSQDTKDKISKGHTGKPGHPLSQATKDKMSKDRMGEGNPMYGKIGNYKSVMCLETQEIFTTILDASRWVGFKSGKGTPISLQIQGKQEYAGRHPITKEKLHWQFVDRQIIMEDNDIHDAR